MLNKKEKYKICELIAQWEWGSSKSDSISAAMARSDCSASIREIFNLGNDDDDLIFARAIQIQKIVVAETGNLELDGDRFLWFLCDIFEEDYKAACNMVEDGRNFEGLIQKFKLDFLKEAS